MLLCEKLSHLFVEAVDDSPFQPVYLMLGLNFVIIRQQLVELGPGRARLSQKDNIKTSETATGLRRPQCFEYTAVI